MPGWLNLQELWPAKIYNHMFRAPFGYYKSLWRSVRACIDYCTGENVCSQMANGICQSLFAAKIRTFRYLYEKYVDFIYSDTLEIEID